MGGLLSGGLRGASLRGKRIEGFTLVELTVVLTVVILLLLLSFPIVKRSFDKMDQAKGVSILREVGMATRHYLDDHDHRLPILPYTENSLQGLVPRPTQYEYYPLAVLHYKGYFPSLYQESMWDKPRSWRDYDRMVLGDESKLWPVWARQFGFPNGGDVEQLPSELPRVTRVKNTSNAMWAISSDLGWTALQRRGDYFGFQEIPDANGNDPWEQPRHHGGDNVLFLDGHVEWMTRAQMREREIHKWIEF